MKKIYFLTLLTFLVTSNVFAKAVKNKQKKLEKTTSVFASQVLNISQFENLAKEKLFSFGITADNGKVYFQDEVFLSDLKINTKRVAIDISSLLFVPNQIESGKPGVVFKMNMKGDSNLVFGWTVEDHFITRAVSDTSYQLVILLKNINAVAEVSSQILNILPLATITNSGILMFAQSDNPYDILSLKQSLAIPALIHKTEIMTIRVDKGSINYGKAIEIKNYENSISSIDVRTLSKKMSVDPRIIFKDSLK